MLYECLANKHLNPGFRRQWLTTLFLYESINAPKTCDVDSFQNSPHQTLCQIDDTNQERGN